MRTKVDVKVLNKKELEDHRRVRATVVCIRRTFFVLIHQPFLPAIFGCLFVFSISIHICLYDFFLSLFLM
jgi:hypothetical protein